MKTISLAVLALTGAIKATFTPTRDSSTSANAFPLYHTYATAWTAAATDGAKVTEAANYSADNTKGGYQCVRTGLLYAHSQKLDIAINAGGVVTDANLRAFYGTTGVHLGIVTTPFNHNCYY